MFHYTPVNNSKKDTNVSSCNLFVLEENLKQNSKCLIYDELKYPQDIDNLAQLITDTISRSVKNSTFQKTLIIEPTKFLVLPKHIIALIKEKRKMRKKFHVTQDHQFKSQFNSLNSRIKKEITSFKSKKWQDFCTSLNNHNVSDSVF